MKRLKWKWLLVPSALLIWGLGNTETRASQTLQFAFTDRDNFGVSTSILPAVVTLNFTNNGGGGGTLDIDFKNESSTYTIAGFFFNAANAGTLSYTGSSAGQGFGIGTNDQADGYGKFGYHLSFGNVNTSPIQPNTDFLVHLAYTGALSIADLMAFSTGGDTSDPNKGDAQAVIDWKAPTGNPTGFGAGTVVPEPSTLLGAALASLIGLGFAWRRRTA